MNKTRKVAKTTDELIKERKEKRRLKAERFIAKLERLEQRKERTSKDNISLPEPRKGRQFTISIALPCSVLDNCQSQELKCYLASQVARSAAIFGIDEIIVFNDTSVAIPAESNAYTFVGKQAHSAWMMASILQYMECPPQLRKFIFPNKREFELAAQMNPLGLPHHKQDHPLYREGIVSDKHTKSGHGCYINVGSQQLVWVDRSLEEKVRVTVKLGQMKEGEKKMKGTIVSPSTPQLEHSIYWGYSVRIAKNFKEVFTGNTSGWKYDVTIGTSDKGEVVDEVELKQFKHLLIVFGGLQGLETCIESDESIKASEPSEIFDKYLNTCPNQGSRTIRTEEAIFISLAALQPLLPQ